jgi:RNA-directed DNA polymerase
MRNKFHPNSYGLRPHRYAEMAILETLRNVNDGYQWIVDIDLERFFDTVNHDRLVNLILRTSKDRAVISLIRKYLVSGDKRAKDTKSRLSVECEV